MHAYILVLRWGRMRLINYDTQSENGGKREGGGNEGGREGGRGNEGGRGDMREGGGI